MSKKFPHFENHLVKHLKLCNLDAATLLMGGKSNNCLGFPAIFIAVLMTHKIQNASVSRRETAYYKIVKWL